MFQKVLLQNIPKVTSKYSYSILERGEKRVLEGTITLCCTVNPQIIYFHQHSYQSATALRNVYASFKVN